MKKRVLFDYFALLTFVFILLSGCASKNNNLSPKESTKNPPVENQDKQEQKEHPREDEISLRVELEKPKIVNKLILREDFENGNPGFSPRGSETIEIINNLSYQGNKSLRVANRKETWNGPIIDLTDSMIPGEKYHISAWLKYENADVNELIIDCKVEKNGNEYLDFGTIKLTHGKWDNLIGDIELPKDTTTAAIYFETIWKTNPSKEDLVDFYLDTIELNKLEIETSKIQLPSLAEAYKDCFSMGISIVNEDLKDEVKRELITEQFNSITMGNELKPDYLLDYNASISDSKHNESPVLKFDTAKPGLDFAKENGLKFRGHTLIWHSQTPRWLFTEGYSKKEDAPLVSREIMLKRMENYIRQVFEYTNENYPDLIYGWDVVNEAINPDDGAQKGYRSKDSLWYQVIGEDYVEKAFEYTRKYAPKNVKLFYNDYNTYEPARRVAIYNLAQELKEKGLIDGIGMQSHITIDYPSLVDYEATIKKFAQLDLEIHITELDMNLQSNGEEDFLKQAKRYKRLFTTFKRINEEKTANITNVTFWGISDEYSWLNKDGPNYPLLFNKYLQPKEAFWGVLRDVSVPLY
ncbi:MAG: glycoside hydrolase [Epulopiscium sp.]|nr:glycoside hydrolase [Candidatus Epulonipiscium sp.]